MRRDELIRVGQSHEWNKRFIINEGYRFIDAYKGHGLFFRILRELFFRLRLPGKSLFYNREIITENKVLVVGEALITYDYMRWLHKHCPTCKIILFFDNPVNPKYSPDGFSDEWCTKWTSDKADAEKYNLHLYQGGGYFRQWKASKTNPPEYDVFYIGKDKKRLELLKRIEEALNSHGAKTLFYITWERGWQKKDDGIHKPFLPYDGVLDYIGKSRAILHLIEGAQNGITLRIQESLIHRVKLITDDVNIVDYDFYNPNNIFILGRDDLNGLRAFLDAPYVEVESDFYNHAYFDQMLEEIVGKSIGPEPGSQE